MVIKGVNHMLSNNNIPVLNHDLFGLIAQHLSFEDLINLKKTCKLANLRGVNFEEKALINPTLLLRVLVTMSRMRLGCFLQYYFRPESMHEAQLAAIVNKEPENESAIACYALVARRDVLKLHEVNIAVAHTSLLAKGYPANSSLMQGLAFINYDHTKYRYGELFPNAVFNMRGLKCSYWQLSGYDFSAANMREMQLTRTGLNSASLIKTDFRNACLVRTKLRGAKMDGANLAYTLCTRIRLNGATLIGANLCGTYMLGRSICQIEREENPDLDPVKYDATIFIGARYDSTSRLFFSPKKHAMVKVIDMCHKPK